MHQISRITRGKTPILSMRAVFTSDLKITGWIDKGLNEKAYIIPGLGDFGERRQVCLYCYHFQAP